MAVTPKAFGKRQSQSPTAGVNVRPTAPPAQPAGRSGAATAIGVAQQFWQYKLVRQAGAVLLGVALLLGVKTFNYFQMTQVGKNLSASFDKVGFQAVEPDHAGDTLSKAADACLVRSRSISVAADIKNVEIDPVIIGGEASLARKSYYLKCVASEDLALSCNYGSRREFADGLASYISMIKQVREERGFTQLLSGNRFRDSLEAGGKNTVIQSGGRQSDRFDPQLEKMTRDLVARGRFADSDFGRFGWFTPSEMQKMIGDVAVTRKECP